MAPAPTLSVTLSEDGGATQTELVSGLATVFVDGADTLSEGVTFHSATPSTADPDANWDTFFSIHLGIKEAASGTWDVVLMPVYGSYADPDERPYYTRHTITVTFGDGTQVNIDEPGGVEIIGHGQAIPPTVVVWNPSTEVVDSSVPGHSLAFVETTRILKDPSNRTGFADDGEFVVRYDHTIEGEDRAEFYAVAGWPCQFVASTGSFLRGDVADPGESFGFTLEERGPYIEWEDWDAGATNYPITHLDISGNDIRDEREWDNDWDEIGYEQRLDSGIGPLCGNIVSRGATYLRDFGMCWLVKSLAARLLTQFPHPLTPHARNPFVYNYDKSAMRGKGRIIAGMVWLWRALNLMVDVRDTAVDTEVVTLRDALATRATGILDLLKVDYANNSYLSSQGGGVPYWELGHYWQGLLIYQEALYEVSGVIDPVVDDMMRTFATEIHANTLEWMSGSTHPRGGGTYTGSNGWYLEYLFFGDDSSTPTTGIAPTLVAVYEWAKVNGLDQGAKQDAIIAQSDYVNADYKWHYGGTTAPRLLGNISGTMGVTVDPGTTKVHYRASIGGVDGIPELTVTGRVNPTVGGAAYSPRTGTPIATAALSVGTFIELGPAINTMGTKAFDVVRGDDFQQPFAITLDQSRTLDGTESWTFSVRETLDDSSPVLIELTKAGGGITIGTVNGKANSPTVIFTPADFAAITKGPDKAYVFDLEMTKVGKFETQGIDTLTVLGDVSR